MFVTLFIFSCSAAKKTMKEEGVAVEEKKVMTPQAPINDLWVTCYGFGTTKGSSLQNAIQNGFRALLQDGFQGDYFPHPLLGQDGKKIIASNPAYFDRFFNSDMHLFVLDREISYFEYKSATEPSSKLAIKVNVDALRKQLIKDKIMTEPGPHK